MDTDISGWSVDTDKDFVVFQLDLTGSSVISAYGFGSNTGIGERTQALVYIETEDATVVTLYTYAPQCLFVSKVIMATTTLSWSKKTCIASSSLLSRSLVYDSSTQTIYSTSDFAN